MQIWFSWGKYNFRQHRWSESLSFRLGLAVATIIIALPLQVQARNVDRAASPAEKNRASNLNSTRLAQADGIPLKITGVKLNPKASGIEVVLETAGTISAPAPKTTRKLLYFDLPNATIAQPFRANNPAQGIESVSVTQIDSGYVRVTVTGSNGTPQATVIAGAAGTTPAPVARTNDSNEPELEINVIGTLRNPYRVKTSGVTGTNTPIIETPFAVQVIPQAIIRDQQVRELKDALTNVSGVIYNGDVSNRSGNTFSIRGFSGGTVLQDGFRRFGSDGEGSSQPITEVTTLEQIEVLKGPASILYGAIEPGGVINTVSKKPLANPFYEVEIQGGSGNLVRPRFDVSGPLTADGKLLYRVNGLYQTSNSYTIATQPDQKVSIAPTIAWKIDDKTNINFSVGYIAANRPTEFGLPAIGTSVANVPRDRILTEPSDTVTNKSVNIGYKLDRQLNSNWKLSNAFRYSSYEYDFGVIAVPLSFDEPTLTANRGFASQDGQTRDYSFQTSLTGEFATGDVKHTLLTGVDYVNRNSRISTVLDFTPRPLDLFNPTYGIVKPSESSLPAFGGNTGNGNSFGFYLQDQVAISKNLKLLAGVRYDTLSQTTVNIPGAAVDPGESSINASALTPRFGLLYQLNDKLSLYGSYSQSFTPNSATTSSGAILEPQRGKGYEFGVKSDLLDGKLFATLAYFDISKQNVPGTDPNNPLFSIAIGEQRSRGIELDVAGEIAPGWKVIATYAYTNADVTADSDPLNVGKKLSGVPEHAASLWTTYEIGQGNLKGLGFGAGMTFKGDRQGDLANTFRLGSYVTADAAIFYKRDDWRFGLNFKNIGDLKYVESNFASRAVGNDFGEPFSVSASVGVEF
jgi:iron complex outermembrane recepter protein